MIYMLNNLDFEKFIEYVKGCTKGHEYSYLRYYNIIIKGLMQQNANVMSDDDISIFDDILVELSLLPDDVNKLSDLLIPRKLNNIYIQEYIN